MANVTRDQLIEAAKLVPPSSLVSEGELLAFATGLSAFLEHGSDLVAALEDDNPALAIATLYNPEPDGPVLAGADVPVPESPGEVPVGTLYNPEPDGPVLAGTDAPVPEPAPGEVPPA